MQPSWVLSEQERERRFNKLKKVAYRNNLMSHSDSETGTTSLVANVPKSIEIHFTIEEQLKLESLRDYIKATAIPKFDYFFDCEPDCLVHLATATYFGGPLNYELWTRYIMSIR